MANLLPALCLFLAAVILIYFYPLNRKETLKMEETLNKFNGISK
jgi:GPH family glycoside/pentoside/hexuronide:cation symporter